ncbi:MAG TPA: helix-turn-helix transcriptional regulator [Gemmatimonadota bacterium]|nr:helix-turn-helix transcriptional regulator [Gemmatimonadota bacterium]
MRNEVGRRLQEIRGRRDQRTFAEAIDSVQQTISKYERGEIPRSWLFLARLAEAENIDLNHLLTGREKRSSGNGDGNGRARATPEREPAEATV